jgi:ribose 1,5-bisphosphokinase
MSDRAPSTTDRIGIEIGPGRLVLVVGPSGAGKDTLIDGVRAACRHDGGIVFPRRVITRLSSAAEDHDTMPDAAFDQAANGGAFALWWTAHGLKYGIPATIDDDIRAGRTVVCNVSRTVIGRARERYACVTVALVTAPQDILAARLRERGRGSDGSIMDRVQRSVSTNSELNADVVIENIGTVESAAGTLLRVVSRRSAESKS